MQQRRISMRRQIEVVYEKGMLRPLGPLPEEIREHQHLIVTVEPLDGREVWLDTACVAAAARDADPAVSLEEVRKILANVHGSLAEAVAAEREER
jgi:hypothetical protein